MCLWMWVVKLRKLLIPGHIAHIKVPGHACEQGNQEISILGMRFHQSAPNLHILFRFFVTPRV
jgi:hypothetical protein